VSYTHAAGDQFIFKGGVTWTSCFPFVPSTKGSAAAGNDYYGVDLTWFNGSSFARPIFDGAYLVDEIFGLLSFTTVDNIEMCNAASGTTTDGWGIIVVEDSIGSLGGASQHTLISNCLLHDWKTTGTFDGAHGGFWAGNADPNLATTNQIVNTEIHNSSNGTRGTCVRMAGLMDRCKIHDNSSGILFCAGFTNGQLYNISGQGGQDPGNPGNDYHTNGCYLDCVTAHGGNTNGFTAFFAGNIVHDCQAGANAAYLNGRGSTTYCYNNIFYGQFSVQCPIEIEPYDYGGNITSGSYYIWNNIIINTNNAGGIPIHIVNRSGKPQPSLVQIQNNYIVSPTSSVSEGGPAASYIADHNLVHTQAQSTAAGFSISNLWAPTSGTQPTVNTGTSAPSAIFAIDINGITRPQGGNWDIGPYEWASGGSTTQQGNSGIGGGRSAILVPRILKIAKANLK
jgi:hypothetical protein